MSRGRTLAGRDLEPGADLAFTNLNGTDLRGADLTSVVNLGLTTGSATYDLLTDFTGSGFDPVAAGWTLVVPASVPAAGPVGIGILMSLLGLVSRRRLANVRGAPSCSTID